MMQSVGFLAGSMTRVFRAGPWAHEWKVGLADIAGYRNVAAWTAAKAI